MRRARIAVAGAVVATALTALPARAGCFQEVVVTLSAAGPDKPSITVAAGQNVLFQLAEGVSAFSRVIVDGSDSCGFDVAPGLLAECSWFRAGTFAYRVEGFGAGTGSVTVLSPTTIGAATFGPIVFGESATLSGGGLAAGCRGPGPPPIPSGPTPERRPSVWVQVFERPSGAEAFDDLRTVPGYDGEGVWHTNVRPAMTTQYKAVSWAGDSETITIAVRPRIRLSRVRDAFRATVEGARSFTGRRVVLQRHTARGWVGVRPIRLGADSTARFMTQLHGLVRVVMTRRQAGPGYVAGFSRSLRLSAARS